MKNTSQRWYYSVGKVRNMFIINRCKLYRGNWQGDADKFSINSWWLSDAIWRHRYGSTLVQLIATRGNWVKIPFCRDIMRTNCTICNLDINISALQCVLRATSSLKNQQPQSTRPLCLRRGHAVFLYVILVCERAGLYWYEHVFAFQATPECGKAGLSTFVVHTVEIARV